MKAPTDNKAVSAPRQFRSVGPEKSKPEFELTEVEMAWAVRFFSACRRMSDESRTICMTFAAVAEKTAARQPCRPTTSLRLVSGGTA